LLFYRSDLQFIREQIWLPGSDRRGILPGRSVLGAERLRAECSNTVLHHRPGNRYVQRVVQLEL